MVGTPKNTDDEIRFILDLYRQGMKPKEIAPRCDLKFKKRTRSPQSVSYVLNKYKNDPYFKPEPAPTLSGYEQVASNQNMYSSQMINQQQPSHLSSDPAQHFSPSSYTNNPHHQLVSHPASNSLSSIDYAVQGESLDTGLGQSRYQQPSPMGNHLQRYATPPTPNSPGLIQQTVSNLLQRREHQNSLTEAQKRYAASNKPHSNPEHRCPAYRPTGPNSTPSPPTERVGATRSGSLTLPTFDPNFDSTQWAPLPAHLHIPNLDSKSKPSMGPKRKKGKESEVNGSEFDIPIPEPVYKLNAAKTGIVTKTASMKNNLDAYIRDARWRNQNAVNKAAIEAAASSAAIPAPASGIPGEDDTSKKRKHDDVEAFNMQEGDQESGKRHKFSVAPTSSSTELSSPQSVPSLSTSDSPSTASSALNTPQPAPQAVNTKANKRQRGNTPDHDIEAREEAIKRRREYDEHSTNHRNGRNGDAEYDEHPANDRNEDADIYTDQEAAADLQHLDAEDANGYTHSEATNARWAEPFLDAMSPFSQSQDIIEHQEPPPELASEKEKRDWEDQLDAIFSREAAVDTSSSSSCPGMDVENWVEENLGAHAWF